MPNHPHCVLAAEKARAKFFARREVIASERCFVLTFGAVIGVALVGMLLPKAASLFLIAHIGPRACLFALVAYAYAFVRAIQAAIPYLNRPWERALHDRISAEIRVGRIALESTD